MGDRDGIGGEMVWTRTKQAAGNRLRGTETKTVKVNPGKAKLIAAVDKKVGENSEDIAQKLIDSVKNGDWTGAKLLYAMADGLIDCENPEVMSQLCSYAESLAGEQQVAAETADAVAETVKKEGEVELAIQ